MTKIFSCPYAQKLLTKAKFGLCLWKVLHRTSFLWERSLEFDQFLPGSC